jgi:dihydrofolate reductase
MSLHTTNQRIVTFNNVSADGYFTSRDDQLDWVVNDPAVTSAAMERTPHVDTMLFGRKTFEMFEGAWRDNDADPHSGARDASSQQMAQWINEHPKVVFSRTLRKVTWKNSRVLHDVTPASIAQVKEQAKGDCIVFGSGMLAAKLTELGLVDEHVFIVSPVLLGGGRTLLNGVPRPTKLTLLESRAFDSGCVLQRYARGA